MSDAPERIWATEDRENFGEDRFHATTPMRGLTEYLRADIAAAREAELRAEVERLSGLLDEARGALEVFASDVNWKCGGPFDPNSPSFVGIGTASATLAKIGGQHD